MGDSRQAHAHAFAPDHRGGQWAVLLLHRGLQAPLVRAAGVPVLDQVPFGHTHAHTPTTLDVPAAMSEVVDTSSEQYRRECEARHWLRCGYRTAERVDELMERIEARRGREAAQGLRQEMRRQWARRAEWGAEDAE